MCHHNLWNDFFTNHSNNGMIELVIFDLCSYHMYDNYIITIVVLNIIEKWCGVIMMVNIIIIYDIKMISLVLVVGKKYPQLFTWNTTIIIVWKADFNNDYHQEMWINCIFYNDFISNDVFHHEMEIGWFFRQLSMEY